MPASQPVQLHPDYDLFAEVESLDECGPVYFTDQSPRFEVTIKNESEHDFSEESGLTWNIAIGQGMPSPIYQGIQRFEVKSDEEDSFVIGDELLAFEGHGVVGLQAGAVRGSDDSKKMLTPGSKTGYKPSYTFSVWDRSQYETLHDTPRKMQKISIWLTGAIVIASIIQLLIVLFT